MGQRSKQKGGEYEREVAKRLSLWISNGERNDLLWRSSMSGGRATLQAREGNTVGNQSGDLSAISSEAMSFANLYSVECKSYKDLFIGDIIWGLRKSDSIGKFWQQAWDDAKQANKLPMLIAKQNFKSSIIVLPKTIMQNLNTSNFYVTNSDRLEGSISLFEDFLQNISLEELIHATTSPDR